MQLSLRQHQSTKDGSKPEIRLSRPCLRNDKPPPRIQVSHFQFRFAKSVADMTDFANNYPAGWATPPADRLPKTWTDKLASIQLPDVPVSNPNNGYPTYSNGKAGSDPSICSFTYECTTDDDLHIPPDGVWAVSHFLASALVVHKADEIAHIRRWCWTRL